MHVTCVSNYVVEEFMGDVSRLLADALADRALAKGELNPYKGVSQKVNRIIKPLNDCLNRFDVIFRNRLVRSKPYRIVSILLYDESDEVKMTYIRNYLRNMNYWGN